MFKQKEPWQAVARTMSWSKAGNLGTGRTVFYTLRQVMFNVTVTQCSQKGFLFVFLMCKFTFPQLLIIHRKKKKKKKDQYFEDNTQPSSILHIVLYFQQEKKRQIWIIFWSPEI